MICLPTVYTLCNVDKVSFQVFATFFLSLMMLLFSISIMSDSFLFVLLEINGLTVFHKFLFLSIPDLTFVYKILFDSFPSEFYK